MNDYQDPGTEVFQHFDNLKTAPNKTDRNNIVIKARKLSTKKTSLQDEKKSIWKLEENSDHEREFDFKNNSRIETKKVNGVNTILVQSKKNHNNENSINLKPNKKFKKIILQNNCLKEKYSVGNPNMDKTVSDIDPNNYNISEKDEMLINEDFKIVEDIIDYSPTKNESVYRNSNRNITNSVEKDKKDSKKNLKKSIIRSKSKNNINKKKSDEDK